VVLCGVSPLIWRRLLVRNDGTIADLYAIPPPRSGLDRRALELLFVIESRECGVANSVASAPPGEQLIQAVMTAAAMNLVKLAQHTHYIGDGVAALAYR
jgi:hypothetical protein